MGVLMMPPDQGRAGEWRCGSLGVRLEGRDTGTAGVLHLNLAICSHMSLMSTVGDEDQALAGEGVY